MALVRFDPLQELDVLPGRHLIQRHDAPSRLLLLGDGRFRSLETNLAMGAVTEGLGDRRATPAQRESRPAPACLNLATVDVYQFDLAFHKIRAVGPDADLYGHETPPHKIGIGHTIAWLRLSALSDVAFIGRRTVAKDIAGTYQRYALAANGVSPMAIPGTLGGQYTADGLTHNPRGTPTSGEGDHRAQLDKRRDKLEQFNYGAHWGTIEGDGDFAIVTWGSLTAAVREAIERAAADGIKTRLVAPRLLLPTRPEQMAKALEGVKRILVVEQTHGGQFHRYLRAHYDLAQLPGSVVHGTLRL